MSNQVENAEDILSEEDSLLEEAIQTAFDEAFEDYELDATMSIEDIFYEMFAAGFEVALATVTAVKSEISESSEDN